MNFDGIIGSLWNYAEKEEEKAVVENSETATGVAL